MIKIFCLLNKLFNGNKILVVIFLTYQKLNFSNDAFLKHSSLFNNTLQLKYNVVYF
jgi:hypothetical protein